MLTERTRQFGKLERLRPTTSERLEDRLRPVEEHGLRRKELDVDEITGERAEGERRLERCDAAAGDEHVGAAVARGYPAVGHAASLAPTGARTIGVSRDPGDGKLRADQRTASTATSVTGPSSVSAAAAAERPHRHP